MLAILGRVRLEVTQVAGLSGDRSWTYASHATIQDLPVLQYVARNSSSFSLACKLHHSHGDVTTLRSQLAAAGDSGEVMPLQLGTGELLGYYVLEKLQTRLQWTTPSGQVLAQDLALSLTEHRPPDVQLGQLLAVEGSTGPDRTTPALPDTTREIDDVPLSEIVRSG